MHQVFAGDLKVRVHLGTILRQLFAQVRVRVFLTWVDSEYECFCPANLFHSHGNRRKPELLISQLLHRRVAISRVGHAKISDREKTSNHC